MESPTLPRPHLAGMCVMHLRNLRNSDRVCMLGLCAAYIGRGTIVPMSALVSAVSLVLDAHGKVSESPIALCVQYGARCFNPE